KPEAIPEWKPSEKLCPDLRIITEQEFNLGDLQPGRFAWKLTSGRSARRFRSADICTFTTSQMNCWQAANAGLALSFCTGSPPPQPRQAEDAQCANAGQQQTRRFRNCCSICRELRSIAQSIRSCSA